MMSSDPGLEPDPGPLPLDVMLDLMPLYRSGGLRPGTRKAIAAQLAAHPEIAALASVTDDDLAPRPELELRSLRRTHRLLALQRWLFGLSIACFALSLSLEIHFGGAGLPRAQFLLFSHPALVAPFLPAGVAFWAGYRYLRSRLLSG